MAGFVESWVSAWDWCWPSRQHPPLPVSCTTTWPSLPSCRTGLPVLLMVLLPAPAGPPPSPWEHCNPLLSSRLPWAFTPLLPPGYSFIKHKSNSLIRQLKILHLLPCRAPCMADEVLWYSFSCTFLLPVVTVLLLPSLLPLGLAAIYLYVKIQPRLHHLCPMRSLYPSSSTIRPAS